MIQCQERLLGLAFAYPSAWGTLYATTIPGESGLAYSVRATESDLQGGGLSSDYTQAREGTKLDFSGFRDRSLSDYCGNRFVVWPAACQAFTPHMAVVVGLPAFEEFCFGYTDLYQPEYRILIDLPDTDAIHGFVWIIPFLSADYLAQIDKRLGRVQSQSQAGCLADGAADYYESELQAIRNAFRHELFPEFADSTTTQNIRHIQSFVASLNILQNAPR